MFNFVCSHRKRKHFLNIWWFLSKVLRWANFRQNGINQIEIRIWVVQNDSSLLIHVKYFSCNILKLNTLKSFWVASAAGQKFGIFVGTRYPIWRTTLHIGTGIIRCKMHRFYILWPFISRSPLFYITPVFTSAYTVLYGRFYRNYSTKCHKYRSVCLSEPAKIQNGWTSWQLNFWYCCLHPNPLDSLWILYLFRLTSCQ
jgi:hypothetical protein